MSFPGYQLKLETQFGHSGDMVVPNITFDTGGNLSSITGTFTLGNSASTIGFFGAVPYGKPVIPLTTPTLQQLITALVNLGLVSQSDS
jgi:hypothetical protein